MDEFIEIEIKRLTELLRENGVSERRIKVLEPVIQNTAFMKAKLDETRELINDTSVVIPYDNGGGQKGLRENPIFKGYESLWKSYMQGMQKIIDAMPQEASAVKQAEEEKPRTMLEIVRARKKHKCEVVKNRGLRLSRKGCPAMEPMRLY